MYSLTLKSITYYWPSHAQKLSIPALIIVVNEQGLTIRSETVYYITIDVRMLMKMKMKKNKIMLKKATDEDTNQSIYKSHA